MATVNRLDPYRNFKFEIGCGGKVVAGVNKVGGLIRTSQAISWREGGDPSAAHKSPGRVDYSPITLEQGLTHDA
ncbi:MAG: phage tail protein, partial [Ilumatobacteraceae bacterium]